MLFRSILQKVNKIKQDNKINNWKVNFINDLIETRDFKQFDFFNADEINFNLKFSCIK